MRSAPAKWMLVSKPLREPFCDGTLALCRTFLEGISAEARFTYFGDPERPVRMTLGDEIIDAPAVGFSPSFFSKARMVMSLLNPLRRHQPLHFFFTPNVTTSFVLRVLRLLQPKRVMVQSVTSGDRIEGLLPLLAPLDRVVVLSNHTRGRLVDAGLSPERVERIYPGVPPPPRIARVQENRCILYAGDLNESAGKCLVALARSLREEGRENWTLVIACRPKSEEDRQIRKRLRRELEDDLAIGRVELHGQVDDMETIFCRAALQVFVSHHVEKKIDHPLVLLEGLARGLGLVTVDIQPVSEIMECAKECGLSIGKATPAGEPHQLVHEVLVSIGDPELLGKWSKSARELAERKFSAGSMARQYEALYRRFLSPSSFRPGSGSAPW